jgi:dihydroxy-acid dehydratase
MIEAADDACHRRGREGHGAFRLPDLRLVLGHVHRQFDELPDRGAGPVAARQRLHRRHPRRPQKLFLEGRALASSICAKRYYQDDASVLPRSIANFAAFENAMRSTSPWAARPTPCCTCWPRRARRRRLHHGRHRPHVAQGALPVQGGAGNQTYHMEDVHRAGGIMAILGRTRPRRPDQPRDCQRCTCPTMGDALDAGTSSAMPTRRCMTSSGRARRRADAGRLFSQDAALRRPGPRPRQGRHPRQGHAFSKDGGLAVLFGNIARDGCIVKTAASTIRS